MLLKSHDTPIPHRLQRVVQVSIGRSRVQHSRNRLGYELRMVPSLIVQRADAFSVSVSDDPVRSPETVSTKRPFRLSLLFLK